MRACTELCAEVGDGLTGRRRRIVGVSEPPLLQQRSDTPCPMLTSSSCFSQGRSPGLEETLHPPRELGSTNIRSSLFTVLNWGLPAASTIGHVDEGHLAPQYVDELRK